MPWSLVSASPPAHWDWALAISSTLTCTGTEMLRVLITRPRAQAETLTAGLQAAGFQPFFLPVIEIRALKDTSSLERALARLEQYAWLVLTSTNAVDMLWKSPALRQP